jgi:hypothetical protein
MREEKWRDIIGYESRYAVSSFGRVKSLCRSARTARGYRTVPEKILRTKLDKDGYLDVVLYGVGGRSTQQVHRLVLRAFKGEAPEGKTKCRHLDGKPARNIPSNLEWGTNGENMSDRKQHSTNPLGVKCSQAVLTEDQVRAIRAWPKIYGRGRRLAEIYKVDPMTISCILTRKTWKHI